MSGAEIGAPSRCRVCLQHQEDILPLDNVIAVQNEKVSLGHILVSCCAVEIVDDDQKPQTICTKCAQDAENSYKFKQTVEKADMTLQYELAYMNVKKEEIDIDEGEDMAIQDDYTTVPIKDEFPDCVSTHHNADLRQLQFKHHSNSSSVEQLICKICQTYVGDCISLEHHLEDCCRHVCGVCRQTFTSNDALTEHARTHDAPNMCTKIILKQRKLESHKCRFCKMSYKFPADLRYHVMTHTTVKHSRHSYKHITKKTDGKAAAFMKTKSRFACSVCKKSYRWQKSLMNHECINASNKPKQCFQCSKVFAIGSNLKEHERIHTGEKPHECPDCSRRFIQQGALKSHMLTHTGEKPYECSHCSKRFAHQSTRARHERIHTGDKPYECSHCTKRFNDQSSFNAHERTHTGEKPYECSHCGKRFTDRGSRIRHERTHTGEKPYECSYCSNRFASKAIRTRHEQIHTGEKPFECSQCGKRFGRQGDLTAHGRIHTGEKPYECSHCTKRFNHISTLKKHLRTHAGEIP